MSFFPLSITDKDLAHLFYLFIFNINLFNWRLITLQYCIGFALHWYESTTGICFPLHTIPLGHLSTPALSILYHASNLDWRFISHMIIYMFQSHSPKSSHPHPLPQSPKDFSIHLCLFCCLTYRVIIIIFLRLLNKVFLNWFVIERQPYFHEKLSYW